MPLIKGNAFVEDSWTRLVEGHSPDGDGDVILTFGQAREQSELVRGRNGRTGVSLPNTIDPAEIVDLLPHLDLIELDFPAFTDGRAYSQARQLRTKLGFEGELRASGTVLSDQAAFMESVGFDSFDVSDDVTLDVWNRAKASMSCTYQRGYNGDALTPERAGRINSV